METIDEANDREERREREMDVLARLAARAGEHALEPGDAANVAFYEWLARDARAGQRSAERRARAYPARVLVAGGARARRPIGPPRPPRAGARARRDERRREAIRHVRQEE